jgi:hypothetical protein
VLESLDLAIFTRHVGDVFRLAVDETTTIEARLIEATPSSAASASSPPNERRAPFSLVFRGPDSPPLSQRIYRLEHPELGVLDVFLVPIGQDAGGMRYEAVFN